MGCGSSAGHVAPAERKPVQRAAFKRVLFADTDSFELTVGGLCLKRSGFDVTCVQDGLKVKELLSQDEKMKASFDAVVIKISELMSLGCVNSARQHTAHSSPAVIAVLPNGAQTLAVLEEVRRAGCSAVITEGAFLGPALRVVESCTRANLGAALVVVDEIGRPSWPLADSR